MVSHLKQEATSGLKGCCSDLVGGTSRSKTEHFYQLDVKQDVKEEASDQ